MQSDDVVMMAVGLGVPAAVIVLLSALRMLWRLRLLEVVRIAAERDQALSAEAICALSGAFVAHPKERDRRRGIMLASFGAAMAVLGLLTFTGLFSVGVAGAVAYGVILAGIGAIPGCIGAGYVLLSRPEPSDD